MSLLPAMPPHFGDGHPANTQFSENFFNRFEPGRLNNRFELRHHNVLVLRLLHGFKSLLRLGSGFHYKAFLPGNATPTDYTSDWDRPENTGTFATEVAAHSGAHYKEYPGFPDTPASTAPENT